MDGKNLAIDAVALAAYLVAANPALTGIGLHEWLSLGALVVLFAHLLAHADWCVDALRTTLRRPTWARTGNLAVDALMLVTLVVVAVSGLFVSGAVLPAFGLYAEGYYFWDPLHAIAAKALLALLLVHLVTHWKWLYRFFRKGKAGEGVRAARRTEEARGD